MYHIIFDQWYQLSWLWRWSMLWTFSEARWCIIIDSACNEETIIREVFERHKDRPPTEDEFEITSNVLISPNEVKMWLAHLQTVKDNRKRGAKIAALTRHWLSISSFLKPEMVPRNTFCVRLVHQVRSSAWYRCCGHDVWSSSCICLHARQHSMRIRSITGSR